VLSYLIISIVELCAIFDLIGAHFYGTMKRGRTTLRQLIASLASAYTLSLPYWPMPHLCNLEAGPFGRLLNKDPFGIYPDDLNSEARNFFAGAGKNGR